MLPRTYDKLSSPLPQFYSAKHEQIDRSSNPENEAIMRIGMTRENIRRAVKSRHYLRSYKEGYVNHPIDPHDGRPEPNIVHVNYIDQIGGRHPRIEELDTHYYCDPEGWNMVIPVIIQLPARRVWMNKRKLNYSAELWVHGYRYTEWSGATMFLVSSDKDTAIRWALREAQKAADMEYGYHLHDQEAQEAQNEEG